MFFCVLIYCNEIINIFSLVIKLVVVVFVVVVVVVV